MSHSKQLSALPDPSLYDARFFLAEFAALLRPDEAANCRDFVHKGCLRLTLAAATLPAAA